MKRQFQLKRPAFRAALALREMPAVALAKQLHIDRSTLSLIERGYSLASQEFAERVASFLNLSINDIFEPRE